MGYSGSCIPIPLGIGGLSTDSAPNRISPESLILANNIKINQGVTEKAPGSLQWNVTALPSGVIAFIDYWPDTATQYLVCVTRAGRVYRFTDKYTMIEITPTTDAAQIAQSGTPPPVLSITERVHIVKGGQEFVGADGTVQNTKLFIFTGNDPIQVIDGKDTVRRNLKVPALDWNGDPATNTSPAKNSYPTFGCIFLTRLFVTGVDSQPHYVYASSDTYGGTPTFMYGHEDFSETTFNTALFNVFPGDGERNKTMLSYKGTLLLLKYPRGLFSLQVPDVGVPAGWYFTKLNDDIGTPSITGAATIQDDVWVMNSVGAIQSLSATLNLGGVSAANILKAMKIQDYMKDVTSPLGFGERQVFWHDHNNTAYCVFRAVNKLNNSLMLVVDFTEQNPKPSIYLKDQPNVLGTQRDVNQEEQLMYGCDDGFLYLMDRENRFVGSDASQTTYTGEFQTPHAPLSISNDPNFNARAMMDKNFDFVEIEFIPTGDVALSCDVYIDGRRTETKTFILSKANQLDHFTLDQSRLQGNSTRRQRLPISGRGRTLSLKFYNSDLSNFKLTAAWVYARIAGVDEKGSLDAGTRDNP